jgi:hypothetical protein
LHGNRDFHNQELIAALGNRESAQSAFVAGQVLLLSPGKAITHSPILPSASHMLTLCVMAGLYF